MCIFSLPFFNPKIGSVWTAADKIVWSERAHTYILSPFASYQKEIEISKASMENVEKFGKQNFLIILFKNLNLFLS